MNSNKTTPVNKKTLHLRFKMSYLVNVIGDGSEEIKECIDNVWDAIDELEEQD